MDMSKEDSYIPVSTLSLSHAHTHTHKHKHVYLYILAYSAESSVPQRHIWQYSVHPAGSHCGTHRWRYSSRACSRRGRTRDQ